MLEGNAFTPDSQDNAFDSLQIPPVTDVDNPIVWEFDLEAGTEHVLLVRLSDRIRVLDSTEPAYADLFDREKPKDCE